MIEIRADRKSSLDALRWANRLLVFDARGEFGLVVEDILKQARHDDLLDRKLLVFTVTADGVIEQRLDKGSGISDLPADDLRNILGNRDAALIGLDGGLKFRYAFSDFTWADLFSRIDAMPMRRAEIRRNESGN